MSQPTAFGAAPQPPAATPAEVPETSRRTAVLAVAAGVVALGVLGGAAVLVTTTGGDPEDVPLPAAAPVVVPSAAPTAPPTAPPTPLPTSAVKGRNVFVPLVKPVVDAAASADPTDGATGAVAGPGGSSTAVPVGPGGIGGSGRSGGSGGLLPVPTVTVTQSTTLTEYRTDTEVVRVLQQQIADLEAQLADSESSETVAALQRQIVALQVELETALQRPAYDFDVFVKDVVDTEDAATDVVFVLADDAQASGFAEYTVGSASPDRTFGPEGELTYLSFDPATGIVTFQYVSSVYRVVEGTALGFSGPSGS